ncbi:MAG TPA: DUF1549 and DUF1553 domain-containing protein [Gemmataceae bacterium]|jgi:hypothetical protein
MVRFCLHVTVLSILTHFAMVPMSQASAGGDSRPVSFRHEVEPILTRAGCNAGACHGTPSGKNGFRLSLRGYDTALDILSLTREVQGRRLALLDPAGSLLLRKATGQTPHEGGQRLTPGDTQYKLLLRWIAEGACDDSANAPVLERLEVFPPHDVLDEPAITRQLRVVAHFRDGSRRDVTHLTRFGINDDTIAVVRHDAIVEKRKAGEVAVTAEYLGQMATACILFRDAKPGFIWNAPPEYNYIDRHVFAKLRVLRLQPAPLCSDSEFLRRVYLDVIGKLPAPDEVRCFLADGDVRKRQRVIDELLERPEFADWWALKWSDRLGCNQRFVGKIGAHLYHEWIRQAMLDNMPDDELARAIVTGRGGNYSNPPAGFYRRLRDPQARAEEVAQLFLGVRIGCARCHNHPGERWTQDDYYGLAAFFARVRYRNGPFFVQIYDKEETVYEARQGEVVHPRTGQTVPPRFLGREIASLRPTEDRREVLARWLTCPDNAFFARNAVNRIWYHLFGQGIVEPVDDFRGSNPPCNDELLDALAADYIQHKYDRKYLIRTIVSSRTYQLSAAPTESNVEDTRYFSHAKVHLLQAEQLLDAIASAAGAAVKFPSIPLGTSAVALPDGEYKHPFLEAFGRPARAMVCECERDSDTNLGQALHLVGGRTIHGLLHDPAGRAARLSASSLPVEKVIEELFLASLGRYPSGEEHSVLIDKLRKSGSDRRQIVEDILWVLVNHKEFLFQH